MLMRRLYISSRYIERICVYVLVYVGRFGSLVDDVLGSDVSRSSPRGVWYQGASVHRIDLY